MKTKFIGMKTLPTIIALLALACVAQGAGFIAGFQPDVSQDRPDLTNVNMIAQAPDGKIVIAGHFRTIDGVPRHGVARLNLDGSVDNSFNPAPYPDLEGLFILNHYLVVQPDGKVVSSGLYDGAFQPGSFGIGRLNTDGSLDYSFQFRPAVGVEGMVLQPDGKILVWGGGPLLPNGQKLGRLLADGTLDSFAIPDLEWVCCVAAQADNKVLVSGDFTMASGGVNREVRRFDPDGTRDSTFNPGALSAGPALAVLPDGKILTSGILTYGGQTFRGVLRLQADASPDPSFNIFEPGAGTSALFLAMQPDGKSLVLLANDLVYPTTGTMARLNSDGTLDGSFHGPDIYPETTVVQNDGKILIGGSFTEIAGQPRHRIARLNADGSLETTQIVYEVTLNVSPDGKGTVADAGTFPPGSIQTVTAVPGRRVAFVNWTEAGTVVSSSASYSFIVDRDRNLVANFLSQPFSPAQAAYQGLFYDTNGVTHQSSGFFRLTTTATAHFSGSLQLGGWRGGFSGRFDSNGIANVSIVRAGRTTVTLHLEVDTTPGSTLLDGMVSDGSWASELLAARQVFDTKTNPAPQAGRYTMTVHARHSGGAPRVAPIGFGYGTILVDKTGGVRLQGALADGTKISQAAGLSEDGHWPLYLPLYGGEGSISGWVTFTNNGYADLGGLMTWSKPQLSRGAFDSGIVVQASVHGSRYHRPAAGQRVLQIVDGQISLVDQNSQGVFAGRFGLRTDNQAVNLGSNQLGLKFNLDNGLFSGWASVESGKAPIAFRGVVEQTQNVGAGYFLGKQTGQVFLQMFQ
jgi:uncharacterized delta-60 repeat protein